MLYVKQIHGMDNMTTGAKRAHTKRTRNPQASRTAILDAAEALFAGKGYRGTSVREIGEAAGVSRGTPGYFFGSKERLYRAVLERASNAARAVLSGALEAAAAKGGGPEALLREGVGAILEFLSARPRYVRLVEWESLGGGRFLGSSPAHLAGMSEALSVVGAEVGRLSLRRVDPQHLLVSLMGLCWFPFAHADTLMAGVGLDPRAPGFVEAHKEHIADLVLRGLLALAESGA